MVYVGDDPVKDGGLAETARIPFVLVPYVHAETNIDETKGQIRLDIAELTELLYINRYALTDGVSFCEVLFGKEYGEIFPPRAETERPYQQWREGRHPYISRERSF